MSNFFFLVTDAMSLKWLVSMKSSSKLFMSWSTHIFSLNFKILHRKGTIHLNADILSREKSILDHPTEQDVVETNIHSLFPAPKMWEINCCNICTISFVETSLAQNLNPKKFQLLQTLPLSKVQALSHINENIIYSISNEKLSYEQSNDRILSEVKSWLLSGGPDNLKHYDSELLYYVELFP